MRIFLTALFFFIAAGGVILAVRDNLRLGLAAAPVEALPAPLATTTTIVGTLTYERNNVGAEVPYIVYQDGGAKTKALVFGSAARCATSQGTYPCALIAAALSAYYPGAISAEGHIDAENLIVSEMRPG
jgi:hypothetical protein